MAHVSAWILCLILLGTAGISAGIGVRETWRVVRGVRLPDRRRLHRLYAPVIFQEAVSAFAVAGLADAFGLLPIPQGVLTGVMAISGCIGIVAFLGVLWFWCPWLFRQPF